MSSGLKIAGNTDSEFTEVNLIIIRNYLRGGISTDTCDRHYYLP